MSKTFSNRSWQLAQQQIEANSLHLRPQTLRKRISRTPPTPLVWQHHHQQQQQRSHHNYRNSNLSIPPFSQNSRKSPSQQRKPQQQHRPFSTSPPTRLPSGHASVSGSRGSKLGPAMSVQREKQTEEAIRKGLFTNDVGLLPGTFIMPAIEKRPSWIGGFQQRWKLEKRRFLTRIGEIGGYLNFRHIAIRPKPPLTIRAVREIPSIAEKLQGRMYEQLALGDLGAIEGELCDGLKANLRARIAQRPGTTSLRWRYHKQLSKPKLMSLRATLTPLDPTKKMDKEDSYGVVQAVVRLHSRQSLQHVKFLRERQGNKMVSREALFDALGRQIPAEEAEERALADAKESVEYVVVQQLLRKSKLGEWMIWGTTEEMSIAKLEQEENKAKGTAQPAMAKP